MSTDNGIFSAHDGSIAFSPILGILIGATLTLIVIILLIILRIRRTKNNSCSSPLEQKLTVGGTARHHNTMSSTKPLLRSCSPREIDERDPDVIPAKYGRKLFVSDKLALLIA